MKTERFSLNVIEQALRATGGIFAHAARWIEQTTNKPCNRMTVRKYCDRHPRLQKVLQEVRENMIDVAESKLLNLIEKDDRAAIIFYLKTQGRVRGYVERVEQTGTNGGPIKTETTVTLKDAIKSMDDLSADELARIYREKVALGG